MKNSYLSLFLLLILCFNSAKGQEIIPGNKRIEKIANKQGFFQNTVEAIVSDPNGYLWFATPNGLVRYDGYSFEYFYHDSENQESIPNNYVTHLLKDSNDKLWIGTKQGLCLYNADKELFKTLNNNYQNVTLIKEGPQKRVWVGKGSTLSVFKSDSSQLEAIKQVGEIDLRNELEESIITDIEFLSETEIIILTNSKILKGTFNASDLSSFDVVSFQYDFNTTSLRKILKVGNSLWIATNKGLYQTFRDNNRLITIKSYFNLNQNLLNTQYEILSLFLDKENDLWIGTTYNGLLKYDNETNVFISFRYNPKNINGLTSNRINCFYEDEFGVVWIGTAQGGINKLDKNQKPFQNYSNNPYDTQSLSGNLITDITEDNKGRIWISFFGNTICRSIEKVDLFEGNIIRFERLDEQFGHLSKQIVVRIFQDKKGYWWIGTHEGVYLYDSVKKILKRIKIKDGENLITTSLSRVITQTDKQHILIGGEQVCVLKNPWDTIFADKPVQTSQLINIGDDNSVNDFVQDNFNNFWFATLNGVFQFVMQQEKLVLQNHLTTLSENNNLKLCHDNIFTIHKNLNRDIWIGTFGGGLMKIQLNPAGQPEKIKSYHKKDGLPDEAVYGILEDENGMFWISTDMGICKFNPISENFDVYNINDGLLNNNFRQSAYLKTSSGIMLMGGLNGLTVFNPKKIKKNQIPPNVLISGLKVNNQPIIAGQEINKKSLIEKSISNTKKLVLNHKQTNISLDIIVQHNSVPENNQLLYMLEGVNINWISSEKGKTTATYTNLRPGTYQFIYKGANGDGIWSDNTDELIIEVLAPWYFRWWSLTIWGILILFIGYEIFKYLVRLEKLKQKLKFEQLEKERVHDMDQAKLRFFTNISHEFKTPLSLIIGPLEKIAEKNKHRENQKYFSIIHNNILRLQRLINQLVSYRKAETGHLELKYSKTTHGNFIYPLLEAFEENTKRININFFYKVYSPERELIIDIYKTEQILLNLFSNAVKFTKPGGEGSISIETGFTGTDNSELFYIEVTDTGIGIATEKIDKIFDRFYRIVEDQGNWTGTGIGLALCKSLTDLMKGTITVESIPGEKTVFKISLPFNQNVTVSENKEISENHIIVTDWMPPELEEVQKQMPDSNLTNLLIIDDEVDVRSFLHEAFKNKYKVTLAVDGEDGLEKLNKTEPQLVICDVMMPKLNGYQVCEKIKSNSETCHIPVILLTALDDKEKRHEGLEIGADDYITKPFSIKQLEIRIKQLIENKQRIVKHFEKSSVVPDDSLNLEAKDRHFLQKITSSIERNMEDSGFGVEELAKSVGLSTSHFYRKLKQLTGQVPNVYLRNFRLQKAAEILSTNRDLNAIEVMYEIGIESPSYFSTSFKKLHGVSPSEYIKNKKG